MLELSAAYLVAAALIGGLLFLAIRNHKQGWRKQRHVWGQTRSTAAIQSLQPEVELTLEHFSDLARLQQSLAGETQVAQKEQLVKSR
jgi:hypothetical protein